MCNLQNSGWENLKIRGYSRDLIVHGHQFYNVGFQVLLAVVMKRPELCLLSTFTLVSCSSVA
jgi:hypothetical protein